MSDKKPTSKDKEEKEKFIEELKSKDPIFKALSNFIKPEYLIKEVKKE